MAYSSPEASWPNELRFATTGPSVQCADTRPSCNLSASRLPTQKSPKMYAPTRSGIAAPRYTYPPVTTHAPSACEYSKTGGTAPAGGDAPAYGCPPSIVFHP